MSKVDYNAILRVHKMCVEHLPSDKYDDWVRIMGSLVENRGIKGIEATFEDKVRNIPNGDKPHVILYTEIGNPDIFCTGIVYHNLLSAASEAQVMRKVDKYDYVGCHLWGTQIAHNTKIKNLPEMV